MGQALAQRGCYVIDCDKATRSPQVYDAPCLEELAAAFGPQVLPGRRPGRAELARRAFASQEARAGWGKSPSPAFWGTSAGSWRRGRPRASASWCWTPPPCLSPAWTPPAPASWRWTPPRRSAWPASWRRDGISQEAALRRLEAQPAGEFYTARADFVVENGPGAQVEEAVEHFLNQLEENMRL